MNHGSSDITSAFTLLMLLVVTLSCGAADKVQPRIERYAHLAPEHLSHEMRRVEEWHDEPTGTPRSPASEDSTE